MPPDCDLNCVLNFSGVFFPPRHETVIAVERSFPAFLGVFFDSSRLRELEILDPYFEGLTLRGVVNSLHAVRLKLSDENVTDVRV